MGNIVFNSLATVGLGFFCGYKAIQLYERYKKKNRFHYDQVKHFEFCLRQCTRDCEYSLPDYMIRELKQQLNDKISKGIQVTEEDISCTLYELVRIGKSEYVDCYPRCTELYYILNGVPLLDITEDKQRELVDVYRIVLKVREKLKRSIFVPFKYNLLVSMILADCSWEDCRHVVRMME